MSSGPEPILQAKPSKDFFVSYTGKDRTWAEWIAFTLEEAGYTTVIQAWDSRPGMNFVAMMNDATKHTGRTIVVLSAAYLESEFGFAEWAVAFRRDPTGRQQQLVPVRIELCEVQGLLGPIVYLDLVGLDEVLAKEQLLAGVKPGRIKPLHTGFPGGSLPQQAGLVEREHPVFPGIKTNNIQNQGPVQGQVVGDGNTVHNYFYNPAVPARKMPTRPVPFPPVWNVPYRYSFFFTGREHVVEELFTTFNSTHSSGLIPIQALSGLGGLGKTQTAVEYAYRYRQHYETVLWMNAETEETLLVSFRTAAELLKRPAAHLQNKLGLLASMQEWFRNTTDWLLILDNADDITWMEPFLPQAASGHLLLTTRATALAHVAQPLRLAPLIPDDGALYLLRRAGYIPWTGQLSDTQPSSAKAARELSRLMDGLPLALEQAGAYIEATGRGVRGYLDLYRQYRAEIQRREHSPVPTYRDPVAFAWSLAREMVQQENHAALELLHACAFLAPHTIPYSLLTSAASLFGPTLESAATHPLVFDRAIAVLLKHSLIKNEVDKETDLPSLTIHPVLQEVLRDSMDPKTRRSWAEHIVQAVTQATSLIEEPIMQVHLRYATLLLEEIKNG